jgi:hypothetical protein
VPCSRMASRALRQCPLVEHVAGESVEQSREFGVAGRVAVPNFEGAGALAGGRLPLFQHVAEAWIARIKFVAPTNRRSCHPWSLTTARHGHKRSAPCLLAASSHQWHKPVSGLTGAGRPHGHCGRRDPFPDGHPS